MRSVTLYTRRGCWRSNEARALLNRAGANYCEVDVSQDERFSTAIGTEERMATLPWVFIGGLPIGGLPELTQLETEGRLDAVLGRFEEESMMEA